MLILLHAKTALDAATKAVPAKANALKKADDALAAAKGDAKKATTAEKAQKEAQTASQYAIQTLADAKAAIGEKLRLRSRRRKQTPPRQRKGCSRQ